MRQNNNGGQNNQQSQAAEVHNVSEYIKKALDCQVDLFSEVSDLLTVRII